MRSRIRLFTVIIVAALLLVTLFAGAEQSGVPSITPDNLGVYNYTYSGSANTDYLILLLDGLYEADESPVVTDTSVLFYDQLKSDADGNLNISMVPSTYRDASLFVAGGGLEKPLLVCHALTNGARDIDSIEITFDADSYTVSGDGALVNANYDIVVKDSFGFETELPDGAERKIVGYTGDKITVATQSDAVILDSFLEAGTYTFSVSYGDVEGTADIVVNRAASVPKKIIVTANGSEESTINITCNNGAAGSTFSPASVVFEAKLYDQYNIEIPGEFEIMSTKTSENNVTGSETTLSNGPSSYTFIPEQSVAGGKTVSYKIVVSEKNYPSMSKKFTVNVTGRSSYTGLAEQLYALYFRANESYQKLQSGEIQEIPNGQSVSEYESTNKYVEKKYVEILETAIDGAEAIFTKIDTGVSVGDTVISKQIDALNNAISVFENNSVPGGKIMIVGFDAFTHTLVSIPLGRVYSSNPANTKPARATEKPVYTSSDTSVATVDASGKVTAVGEGTATITASNTAGTMSANYQVTVYKAITTISFETSQITLARGAKHHTQVVVLPEDHSDAVQYSSKDTDVAVVDSNGVITARKEGSTTITAYTKDKMTAQLKVNVVNPKLTASNTLAKPEGNFSVTISAEKLIGFAELEISATFNQNVFLLAPETFAVATDKLDGYVGTDTTGAANGTFVSKWENNTKDSVSASELITYNFSVLPDAAYGDYTISFRVTATGKNGETLSLLSESRNMSSVVKVGEKDTYTVTVNANNGGSASGGGEFYYGDTVTVRAFPYSTHNFYDWQINGESVSTESEYTLTVTGDVTATARFTVKPSGGGSSVGSNNSGGFGGGGDTTKKVYNIEASIKGGSVPYGTEIKLSTTTENVYIYYTTDGTTPSASNGTLYKEPIKLTNPVVTLQVIGVATGMMASDVAIFTYRVTDIPKEPPVTIVKKEEASTVKFVDGSTKYYRPNDSATRYDVLDMVSKLFNVSGGTTEKVFNDVHSSYTQLVAQYTKAGILNGYPDGTFGGTKGITRAEFVKIVGIMLGLDVNSQVSAAVTFSDISGHWAENYIRVFVAHGYIKGYPEGDFRPDKQVTRAEAVAILNRVRGVAVGDGYAEHFNDVKSDFWAYNDIMAAADIASEK